MKRKFIWRRFVLLVILWFFGFCLIAKCSAQEKFFVLDKRQRLTIDSMFSHVTYKPGETIFQPIQLSDSTAWVLPEAVKDSPSFRAHCAAGREKYIFDQVFLYCPFREVSKSEFKTDSLPAVKTATSSPK